MEGLRFSEDRFDSGNKREVPDLTNRLVVRWCRKETICETVNVRVTGNGEAEICGVQIEKENWLKYLGATLYKDGRSTNDQYCHDNNGSDQTGWHHDSRDSTNLYQVVTLLWTWLAYTERRIQAFENYLKGLFGSLEREGKIHDQALSTVSTLEGQHSLYSKESIGVRWFVSLVMWPNMDILSKTVFVPLRMAYASVA